MKSVYTKYILVATNKEEELLLAMQEEAKGPIPPFRDIRNAKSYWLSFVDSDGRVWPPEPFQWQPNAKRWCRVGEYATGQDLDLRNRVIIAELAIPETPAMDIDRKTITVFQE